MWAAKGLGQARGAVAPLRACCTSTAGLAGGTALRACFLNRMPCRKRKKDEIPLCVRLKRVDLRLGFAIERASLVSIRTSLLSKGRALPSPPRRQEDGRSIFQRRPTRSIKRRRTKRQPRQGRIPHTRVTSDRAAHANVPPWAKATLTSSATVARRSILPAPLPAIAGAGIMRRPLEFTVVQSLDEQR